MRIFFTIIVFFLLYTGAMAQEATSPVIRFLDPEEFYIQMHLHDYYILIDVRTRMEYRISRIPGAILAGKDAVLYSLTDTLDQETPLLLYCTTHTRSLSAAKVLAERGFKNIFVLDPGILGWKSAGKELDR
jgi:thioredoxin 1